MGYYINPVTQSKEQFLETEGIKVNGTPRWGDIPADKVAVCLVNNGMFTAAAIAYSERELDAFNEPGDTRPRTWYVVSRTAVIANSDWAG